MGQGKFMLGLDTTKALTHWRDDDHSWKQTVATCRWAHAQCFTSLSKKMARDLYQANAADPTRGVGGAQWLLPGDRETVRSLLVQQAAF
jgi:hypothetical protein